MKRKYIKRIKEINIVIPKEQFETITKNHKYLTLESDKKEFCNNWRKMHHLPLIRRRAKAK